MYVTYTQHRDVLGRAKGRNSSINLHQDKEIAADELVTDQHSTEEHVTGQLLEFNDLNRPTAVSSQQKIGIS